MEQIKQLRAGAKAVTTDGKSSHVLALVVDAASATVTHLVVDNVDIHGTGRLVPLGNVTAMSADLVTLDLSLGEFVDLDRFLVPGRLPGGGGGGEEKEEGLMAFWLGPPGGYTWVGQEDLPRPSDVVLRSDAAVHVLDGRDVGVVDELLVDPSSGRISGLRLRRGHLLGHRDLIIPAEAIESFDDHGVRLNLDRAALDRLQANDDPAD
jgi:uncharacterized protein YrrD